jgi:hypothetical protein
MTDPPKFREGQQIELGTHRRQIRWLRWWVLPLTILAALGPVAGGVGYWQSSRAIDDNCVRIHRIVSVGSQLIESGDVSLAQYLRDGTITRAQYDRGVAESARQLKRWRSADCPPPKLL